MQSPCYILGISAFYHDSAACLLKDGQIIAAAQEERFSRKKHDSGLPNKAIAYCLEHAGITIAELNCIAFYDKPFLKFERILETYLMHAPKGIRSFLKAMPIWLKDKLFIKENLRKELAFEGPIFFPEHHESHAASAFYPSPFEQAAVLTLDGVGEWATTSLAIGQGQQLKMLKEIHFPHSLGLLYSAFTYYTGFRVNSGEYKVMGLAPYGDPKYVQDIYEHLIDVAEDGSFRLNMRYFNYCAGLTMTSKHFHKLFAGPPRKPETEIRQKDMDLAASVQVVIEEVVQKIAHYARKETGSKNLCLAGGVALNCVSNGKLLRSGIFENIWIQPSAGDAGGALGAAMVIWHNYYGQKRKVSPQQDSQKASLLGPGFSPEEIQSFLDDQGIAYHFETDEQILIDSVAELLNQEKVIGWFQGRMEFGPRALGARSIIGDPRSEAMQKVMNLKIKFRESFRPFAPSVAREHVHEFFELESDSPYMLLVSPVKESIRKAMTKQEQALFGIEKLNIKRSELPAITHVDYSARVQTVTEQDNPRYYQLLKKFGEKSQYPVLINTSFNVRGEPIVCTPEDAYRCFMRTDMDCLVLGNFLIHKQEQKAVAKDESWKEEFVLD